MTTTSCGKSLAESVADLVRIPSVNSKQYGAIAESFGPPGEAVLAETIATRSRQAGAVEVILDEVAPDRPNVYARFDGRSERLVVVDVHTDTVSVEHMTDPPFDGRIDNARVWGRGALDSKATLGVLLHLLEDWGARNLRPAANLLLVGTVSEEVGGLLGATRFCDWVSEQDLHIHQLLVAEPTDFRPVHALRGLVLINVTTLGVAAHSARPELGVNAIEAMVSVVLALRGEHDRLQAGTPATEAGLPTLTVTQIEGGTGSNVVPDRCTVTVGRRLVPGENPERVFDGLVRMVSAVSAVPCVVESILPRSPQGMVGTPAFYQAPNSALIQRLATLANTTPTTAPYGANALRYQQIADETVVFGPGSIDLAHQATEYVEIADLERLSTILTGWLNPA